jgi:outer membrane lipoprotein-sorting protein
MRALAIGVVLVSATVHAQTQSLTPDQCRAITSQVANVYRSADSSASFDETPHPGTGTAWTGHALFTKSGFVLDYTNPPNRRVVGDGVSVRTYDGATVVEARPDQSAYWLFSVLTTFDALDVGLLGYCGLTSTSGHTVRVSAVGSSADAIVTIDPRTARITHASSLGQWFYFTNIQSAASSPRALPPASQAVHDVESFYATSTTRIASFTQTLTVQSQTTTAAGDVVFWRNGHLDFQYVSPTTSRFNSNGTDDVFYDASSNRIVTRAAELNPFAILTGASFGTTYRLQVTDGSPRGFLAGYVLTGVPIAPSTIARVDWFIDERTFEVLRVEMADRHGVQSRVDLHFARPTTYIVAARESVVAPSLAIASRALRGATVIPASHPL